MKLFEKVKEFYKGVKEEVKEGIEFNKECITDLKQGIKYDLENGLINKDIDTRKLALYGMRAGIVLVAPILADAANPEEADAHDWEKEMIKAHNFQAVEYTEFEVNDAYIEDIHDQIEELEDDLKIEDRKIQRYTKTLKNINMNNDITEKILNVVEDRVHQYEKAETTLETAKILDAKVNYTFEDDCGCYTEKTADTDCPEEACEKLEDMMEKVPLEIDLIEKTLGQYHEQHLKDLEKVQELKEKIEGNNKDFNRYKELGDKAAEKMKDALEKYDNLKEEYDDIQKEHGKDYDFHGDYEEQFKVREVYKNGLVFEEDTNTGQPGEANTKITYLVKDNDLDKKVDEITLQAVVPIDGEDVIITMDAHVEDGKIKIDKCDYDNNDVPNDPLRPYYTHQAVPQLKEAAEQTLKDNLDNFNTALEKYTQGNMMPEDYNPLKETFYEKAKETIKNIQEDIFFKYK